jgi:hypothetical protein
VKQWAEAFRYYLSALLNAAYTVRKVVEVEVKRELKKTVKIKKEVKKKYDSWYNNWVTALHHEDRALWDYMDDQRGYEVHELGADTLVKEKVIPAEFVPGMYVSGPPAALLGEAHRRWTEEIGLPPGSQAGVYVTEYYFGDKSRVVQKCEQYLTLLERLLRDVNGL